MIPYLKDNAYKNRRTSESLLSFRRFPAVLNKYKQNLFHRQFSVFTVTEFIKHNTCQIKHCSDAKKPQSHKKQYSAFLLSCIYPVQSGKPQKAQHAQYHSGYFIFLFSVPCFVFIIFIHIHIPFYLLSCPNPKSGKICGKSFVLFLLFQNYSTILDNCQYKIKISVNVLRFQILLMIMSK